MFRPLVVAAAPILMALASPTLAAPVADFALPRPGTTEVFRLSEHRGEYVALHFLLKTECPVCLMHTQTYHKRAAELPGVVQVFIKPDGEEAIAAWTVKAGSDIPIHRDADAALAKTLSIPDGYAFHGESVHYSALVLLNGNGEEVFRYVGKSNADRVKFDDFKAKVAELRAMGGSSPAAKPAAKGPAPIKEYNLGSDKVAIKGYDPVSYFEGKPAAGRKDLTASYRGVNYQFATAAHRDAFTAAPDKYEPEYGGWCAYAMADGEKVDVDPKTYKITDGRLFLFYNGWLGNTLPKWNQDEKGLTRRADVSWRGIAKE